MPGIDLQEEEMRGKIHLGGCCITEDAPNRHCNDCEHQWMKTDNYIDPNVIRPTPSNVCGTTPPNMDRL